MLSSANLGLLLTLSGFSASTASLLLEGQQPWLAGIGLGLALSGVIVGLIGKEVK